MVVSQAGEMTSKLKVKKLIPISRLTFSVLLTRIPGKTVIQRFLNMLKASDLCDWFE